MAAAAKRAAASEATAARTAAATPVASATAAVDDGGGMAASKRIRNDARGKGRLPDEAAATSASAAPTEGRPGRHGDGLKRLTVECRGRGGEEHERGHYGNARRPATTADRTARGPPPAGPVTTGDADGVARPPPQPVSFLSRRQPSSLLLLSTAVTPSLECAAAAAAAAKRAASASHRGTPTWLGTPETVRETPPAAAAE